MANKFVCLFVVLFALGVFTLDSDRWISDCGLRKKVGESVQQDEVCL